MIHFLSQVAHWFTTSSHWHGADGIPHRMWEHVALSGMALLVAGVIALPLAITLGHIGKGGFVAISVANIGRALPSLAILGLARQALGFRGWPGFGARPAFIALVALAIPPMMTNAYTALRGVDPELKEAARGMGMTGRQSLFRVELPASVGLVLAGVRTASVQVVATATLAAVIGWGGLGRYIVDGFAQQDNVKIFAGGLLVALLSFATELVMAGVQRMATPAALRGGGAGGTTAAAKATTVATA